MKHGSQDECGDRLAESGLSEGSGGHGEAPISASVERMKAFHAALNFQDISSFRLDKPCAADLDDCRVSIRPSWTVAQAGIVCARPSGGSIPLSSRLT